MNWKEFVTDYLTFTLRDRIGIVVVIFVILAVFLLPKTFSRGSNLKSDAPDSSWIVSMKRLERTDDDTVQQKKYYNNNNRTGYPFDRSPNKYENKPKGNLFFFDPNTLTVQGWEKLGIREKTIHIIQNYLSKGGHFRKPEDLQRIYGLFPDEFERIAPYIKIESTEEISGLKNFSNEPPKEKQVLKTYAPRYSIIDINSADTTAYIALPGIGSKLAARIINFREKLGGFYSIAQVGETFGLPDSTFQKIKQYLKLENNAVLKININTATIDELKIHPYIKWAIANPIISYRKEHGAFTTVEDIKKIMVVSDEVYNKVAPYLTTK